MQWAAEMNTRGFSAKIITGKTIHPQEDYKTYSERTGVPIEILPSLQREVNFRNDLKALFELKKLIKRESPKIVHTNTSKAGILGRFAAAMNHAPVIVHSPHGHIFYGYFSRWKTNLFIQLERWVAKYTQRITTLTHLGRQDHLDLKITRPEKMVVICPGIDIDKYRLPRENRLTMREQLGISSNKTVIGWVGRVDLVKNPRMLLKAAQLLKGEDLHFLLIGDGELLSDMRRLAKELSIESIITFPGHREDIPAILTAMDIYVLSSLNEGFGRSIIEAQAAGLPVIATNVGGVREIIMDGETGILIPSQDYQALAHKIMKLMKEPALRQRLSADADLRLNRFSLKNTVDNIENLYRELLTYTKS